MEIDDLQAPLDFDEHRKEVWRVTAPLRGIKPHGYGGYGGPWIENWWIDAFQNRPSDAFGGLVPVFAQWVDFAASRGHPEHAARRAQVLVALAGVMRPNVAYVTVSQHDRGIIYGDSITPAVRARLTNLLVLSSGGVGHIPLPLLKQPEHLRKRPGDDSSSSNSEQRAVTCFGKVDKLRPMRQLLHQEFAALPPHYAKDAKWYYGGEWLRELDASSFAMIPRGHGRSAFSLCEVIQMGALPVYVWDDVEWLPYRGSPRADFDQFGLSMRLGGLRQLLDNVTALRRDAKEMARRRLLVRGLARSHFSYRGVVEQLARLFENGTDPVAGSDLRCTGHPPSPDIREWLGTPILEEQ